MKRLHRAYSPEKAVLWEMPDEQSCGVMENQMPAAPAAHFMLICGALQFKLDNEFGQLMGLYRQKELTVRKRSVCLKTGREIRKRQEKKEVCLVRTVVIRSETNMTLAYNPEDWKKYMDLCWNMGADGITSKKKGEGVWVIFTERNRRLNILIVMVIFAGMTLLFVYGQKSGDNA